MLVIQKGRADPALVMDLVLSGYMKPPGEARKLHLCMAPPPASNHSHTMRLYMQSMEKR